jgi:type VI secretion system protein VasD
MRRRPLLILPALVLARCGAAPKPPPSINLALAGGANQNPDAAGRAAPVAVKIFKLTATAKFERADVFALTEREAATLGADSAGSEEFVVAPGENRTIAREMPPTVRFVGAVALFRDIDRSTWRAVVPIADSGPTALRLTISGTTLSLVKA